MTNNYDPAHLRNAANLLWVKGLNDAANVLRTEADIIQKTKLEDEMHLRVGNHMMDRMRKLNKWSINMSVGDVKDFGQAALEAVQKHGPRTLT